MNSRRRQPIEGGTEGAPLHSRRRQPGGAEGAPLRDSQPRFQDVSARVDFPALDARILAFWKEHGIFEKSLEGRDDAPIFVFYEGPPTANGRPGAHHVISRIFKDLFPRYKTMRGYRVPRKAGWDTHGLPVELEVERRLGIDGKGQIEAYGVAEFNQLCRESVTTYLEEWERFTERIGFWVDLDDAYYTFTNEYIESVWWLLRQIWDKDLLYQGHKVVPYCPRCGTAISSHEVAQGYKDVTEDSIYVRFPLTAEAATKVSAGLADGEPRPVSLAVWTTTPWTLISNVAAAVHPDVAYALVESRGERFILARDLVEKVLGKKAEVLREFAGAELLGLDYEAPFGFMTADKRAHFVIGGDYVTTTDGTGIVHIAPAFGEEDMRVGMENDLPVVNAVDTEGKFIAEVTPWAGVFVKDADPAITADLKERGLLLGVEPYEHSYPFCWRCDTALLYYAKATWYVRTTAMKDELIKANDDVVWHPEHIKNGRFGEWLAGNVDWALSRDRYWGTPLPIWRCEEGHTHCVGSVEELRKMAAGPVPEDLELHRPYVDDVVLTCPECGGEMRRAPEVIDAWFDSGSMPFAQWHYPFENVDVFKERFPADFIAEAIDQTRGWFYSLLAIATLIEGRSSYKRVLCLGHILDGEGQKMSKSKGNVVRPDDILDHQGADAFRWFMFSSQQPWSPRRFSAEMVDEVVRKFLLTLWNTYSFFTLYANIDRFDPTAQESPVEERPLIDRWLVGRAQHARQGRHRRPRGLRRHRHRPGHPAVRRRPQQLVRAPQPASLLEERERRRQAGRLPHAARGARDGHQAARAVHAVRGRGAVPEPGALGRRRGAGERAPVRLAGRRRGGHRRRRVVRHGGGAARRRDGPRRAQRRGGQDAPAPGRGRTGAAGGRGPRGRAAPRRRARRAERQGSAHRRLRGRARRLRRQAQPQGARAEARQAARPAPGGAQGGGRRAPWSPPCAPTAPSSSPCRTAPSVSPRRTSSSRPARRRATGWRAKRAASSPSGRTSTTRCAKRAWRASSSTLFSSRAKLPTCVSRTPSA